MNFPFTKELEGTLALRYDNYSDFGDEWSPKAEAVLTLAPEHRLRASYGHGFRPPYFGELYLQQPPFFVGNPDLVPESLMAYEVGYQGTFGRKTRVGFSLYLNDTDHVISSAQAAQSEALLGYNPFYTSANPPPGWPLPPVVNSSRAMRAGFPSAALGTAYSIQSSAAPYACAPPCEIRLSIRARFGFWALRRSMPGPKATTTTAILSGS